MDEYPYHANYTDKHRKIVLSGIEGIAEILTGNDTPEKQRLLFCMDFYLDPYYRVDIPHINDIILVLQNVIVSENPKSVKEEALHLLSAYCWPPFKILEENLDKIESCLMPDVLYAINQD